MNITSVYSAKMNAYISHLHFHAQLRHENKHSMLGIGNVSVRAHY